jgi:hypothetical protein
MTEQQQQSGEPAPLSDEWCLKHGAPLRNEFGDVINDRLKAERAQQGAS